MRAAVITAPGTIEVTTVNDPTPGPKDVVIEVAAVGICGTDLHISKATSPRHCPSFRGMNSQGRSSPSAPRSPGFRSAPRSQGTPTCRATNADTAGLAGPTFAIPGQPSGSPNRAPWQSLSPSRQQNCVRLPEHVRLEDAALIEPLSCAIRGYDVLRSRLGSHVLIYGAGTMGLMMLQLAKLTGAATVDVLDTNPDRAETAAILGCTAVSATADGIDRPGGWDVVIDATGNAKAIQDALARVSKGGTYLQFGVADKDAKVSIEPYRIYNQEITITGSMAVLHSYERAAELFATGIIPAEVFISHRHPLERTAEAFDLFKAGGSRKVQIIPTLTKKA
jgi:threonine dehydrogenase-like Zn-dependent dehydrogenase